MSGKNPNHSGIRLAAPHSVLGKLLTIAAGTLLLVVAFMFSLLALAVAVSGGIVLFLYLRWKTRHLRRHLDEQLRQPGRRAEQTPGGRIIEGEVIGDARDDQRASTTPQPAIELATDRGQPPEH